MYVKDLNTTARMHLDSVLADGYTVNDYGIITDPGKFEGEHFSTILFWQMGLEGFADVDTSDEFQNFYEFHMTPDELADYGLDYGFGTKPLNGEFFYVMLSESDSGFVSLNMQQFSDDDSDDEDDDSPDNDDAPAMTDQEYEQAARAEFIADQYNELRAELATTPVKPEKSYMLGEDSRLVVITDSIKVRLRWHYDDDPDHSYLGEYSDSRESWTIDRKHGVLLGDYEEIVKHLPPAKAEAFAEQYESLGYEIYEYDSPMRGWREMHAYGYRVARENLGRTWNDWRSFRYFKPGVCAGYNPPKDDEEIGYLVQDWQLAEDYNDGRRWLLGVSATLIVDGLEISDSGGLWGIDCELTASEQRSYESEQVHELMSSIAEEAARLHKTVILLQALDPQTILTQFESEDDDSE